MKTLVLFTLVLVAAGASVRAAPLPIKENCNISVDAEKVGYDQKGDKATASGNVVVTYVANQPDKIAASGHVVVVSAKAGIVSGDNAVYDVPKKLVTLTGHVVLKHDKSVLSGTHGTYNLATGIAQVDSTPSAPGSPDGRVHMILTPPPSKGN